MNLDKSVHIVGAVENVADYLGAADIFVHSSKGEGCSNAILEAMCAGLPMVASKTGGTPEIVDDRFSRLFRYKDPEDLYEKLLQMIEHCDHQKMGLTAQSIATERFGIDRMIDNYTAIVENVLLFNKKKSQVDSK
jgi:glycosyltransferase involved in cell wall biosynthesis